MMCGQEKSPTIPFFYFMITASQERLRLWLHKVQTNPMINAEIVCPDHVVRELRGGELYKYQ